ncbi:MAG: DNA alkylation repair protein [Candidatus Omnitrophota bacterium]
MNKERRASDPMTVMAIRKRLRQYADREQAALLRRFFKTGPGEYGEGDVFIGVRVPCSRIVAKEFGDLALGEVVKLLRSRVHEERLVALLILVSQFQSADEKGRGQIYRIYLKNHSFINNWDLIDLSAHHILGGFLRGKEQTPLYSLARSGSLWKRRMAVLATFRYIRDRDLKETLKIARMLLKDKEDLIHKAVGWALREVGKRDEPLLESFLKKHHQKMPRTMLRYAIERFPEPKRQRYLKR